MWHSGHGLVALAVLGEQLDSIISEVFSSLKDSVTLRTCGGLSSKKLQLKNLTANPYTNPDNQLFSQNIP